MAKARKQGGLTRAQRIDFDKLVDIMTDEKHPKHLALKDFLNPTRLPLKP